HRHPLADHGHARRLTALLTPVVALQPLLIPHLLRETADDASIRTSSIGEQRVARGAELRLTHVIVLHRAKSLRRTSHDPRLALFNHVRSIFGTVVVAVGRIDYESAVEAFAGPQPLPADLMAHGTRNAVFGPAAGRVVGRERKMREHVAA